MNTQTVTVSVNRELPKLLVLMTYLLGIFMGALDNGIVGPALSSINRSYGIEASWGVWSFTIYTLFFAVSIPVMGKLSDRYGRKNIFAAGISLFAAGSLLAGLAPNFPLFLMGRAIQAVGTGGIFPITAAQIAATYPPEQRGKYLGYIGVVFGLGSILGPVAGGAILGVLDWQWIFFINVPIAAVILVLLTMVKQTQELTIKPIDFKGIFLLAAAILTVMLGITLENLWLIGLGVLFVFALIAVEKKAADPVMKISYFKKRNTLFILLLSLASGFVMASTINLLPLFSEVVLGMSKSQSGFGVTPLAISSTAASLIGGFLVDKIGAKKVLIIGFAVSLAGALSLAFVVQGVGALLVTILVMGFGIGIIIGAPLNVMIMQAISMQETGSAVGYVSLFRSVGSTMGPAVAGIMITALNNNFSYVYLVSACFSVVSLVMIATMKKVFTR